jgi:hypothetical protein
LQRKETLILTAPFTSLKGLLTLQIQMLTSSQVSWKKAVKICFMMILIFWQIIAMYLGRKVEAMLILLLTTPDSS